MKNIRRLREVDFYYWQQKNKDKPIVIIDNGYGCYSSVEILKENIDNLVLDLQIDRNTGKIFIKIEDESELGYNWLTVYVAEGVE